MFEITLWYIKLKPYIVVGKRGPSCVHDWRNMLKDPTLTNTDVVVVRDWEETMKVLKTTAFVIDPEGLTEKKSPPASTLA